MRVRSVLVAVLLIGSASGWASVDGDLVVALDIGHTPESPGATSARGVSEYSFNRQMVEVIEKALQRMDGISTIIINRAGAEISLRERTEEARAAGADLLISVHHDSVQPQYLEQWERNGEQLRFCDRFRGFSLFYSEENPAPEISLQLARHIGGQLVARGLKPTHHHAEDIDGERRELVDPELGVYRYDRLAVLRGAASPSVLLECGIIVNRQEEQLLSESIYRELIAEAVAAAVSEYRVLHN